MNNCLLLSHESITFSLLFIIDHVIIVAKIAITYFFNVLIMMYHIFFKQPSYNTLNPSINQCNLLIIAVYPELLYIRIICHILEPQIRQANESCLNFINTNHYTV